MATEVDHTHLWDKYPLEMDGEPYWPIPAPAAPWGGLGAIQLPALVLQAASEPLFPPSTGWVLAHRMLTKDQAKLKELLGSLGAQAAAGVALSPAQRAALGAFWDRYTKSLHHHHDNEENVAFPYVCEVKKAIPAPEKACADHVTLLKDLAVCEDLAQGLIGGGVTPAREATALAELLGHFSALDAALVAHYAEEERTMLAPLRRAITPKEQAKHITAPIVGSMDALDRGQYFSKLDAAQLRAFMRQEGIPFFVKYIFKANIRKYNRVVAAPVEAAIASARAAAAGAPAAAA